MSKKKQAMELFEEYGTETMSRIHKILELEQTVIIDFCDLESEYCTDNNKFYDWMHEVLRSICDVTRERNVYIFMTGSGVIECRVSRFDIDPKVRDWSLEDGLFDYCVGSLSQYIDLNKGFGEQQFIDFIESWYELKNDESIDDWDENDEVWDYIISIFADGIPLMKTELGVIIENMEFVINFINSTKSRLHSSCESYLTE